ncbi:hypothetical protein HDU96_010512 [Phlyctochytrium bullatum]|nr:hypothetical protein HDU96_010512 [Phlyctochytrium bullatum]
MHGLHWPYSEALLVESSSVKCGPDDFCNVKCDKILSVTGAEAEATVNVKALIKKLNGQSKDLVPALKRVDCGHGLRTAVLRAAAAIDAGKPCVPAVPCAAEETLIEDMDKSSSAAPIITYAKDADDLQSPAVKLFEHEDMDASSTSGSGSETLDGELDSPNLSAGQLDEVAALEEKIPAAPADKAQPLTDNVSTADELVLDTTPAPAPTKVICDVFSPNGTVTTEVLKPAYLERLRQVSLATLQPAVRPARPLPALPTSQPAVRPARPLPALPASKPAVRPARPLPALPVSQPAVRPARPLPALPALQPAQPIAAVAATHEAPPARRNPFKALKAKLQAFTRKCFSRITRTA